MPLTHTVSTTLTHVGGGQFVRSLVPVGISTGQYLAGLDATARGLVLDAVVNVDASWVRETIAWPNIQPTNSSTFDWSVWDSIVSQCNTRGLQIVADIGGSPAWARPSTYAAGDGSSPPDSPTTFGTFCAAAATRYSATIKHWEIWNEQNVKQFWGGTGASWDTSPTVYYGLLAAAYDAIKAVDPAATIITGGMAPSATGSGYYSPPDYFDALLTAGGGNKCDGYGHHPYSYPLLPSSSFYDHAWRQMYDSTQSLSSIMAAHSATKKIWITEQGCPTNGTGPAGTRANHYGVDLYPPLPDHGDEQVQGDILDESLRAARARPDRFGFYGWYTLLDLEPPGTMTDREKHFGLLESDGTPKDAAAVFTAAIAATGGPA
jgi:hypothetical protein